MLTSVAGEILGLYEVRGLRRYGLEEISQRAHALQCAALAERAGESPAFVLAALLHDVGHLLHELGEEAATHGRDDRHEAIGADWLAERLPPSVSEPVRLHVAAKRYLCATEPGYAEALAPDSALSLRLQGGAMSDAECEAFRSLPFASDAVRLRRLDDLAKEPERATPDLAHFLRALRRLPPPDADRAGFAASGLRILRGYFEAAEWRQLDDWSRRFAARAQALLDESVRSGVSLAALARTRRRELIVVPEAADPRQVCRFEYLLGSDPGFAAFVAARVAPAIDEAAGEACLPFKDKENEKHPGGGAFGPHQDFAAYAAFGPRWNVTAMLVLDPQTRANGCLAFADDRAGLTADAVEEWIEGRPLLRFHRGGPRNGDLHDDVAARLRWREVEAEPGDLVLFDSFVPHRSAPNATDRSRRAMFLTFAPARAGDWYERYYADKRANYDHPKFHVSTPTAHRAVDPPSR